jgi:hypothetical protein
MQPTITPLYSKSNRFHCSNSAMVWMNLNFQLTCPRLERAILSLFPMGETNIQWDNLTHLTLHSMSIIDSFLILRKAPQLVFCKVSGSCGRYRGPSLGALVLTSLKSLQLLIASSVEDFLNNLIAPHLEEFSLPKYYNPSTGVITSICLFITFFLYDLQHLPTILRRFYGSFTFNAFIEQIINNIDNEHRLLRGYFP